jgi:DNA topoisomerase-3
LEAIKCTFPAIGNYIPKGNISSTHKAFDSEKIEAHHAIIPTEKDGSSISLTNEEKNIYQLVAQHFVGLFLAPSKREKTTADIVAYGLRTYRATSTTILEKGWEVVIQKRTEESQKRQNNLSKLSVGEQGDCQSLELTRKETKPAKYFDDASLLKAMTEAAKFVQDPELRKQLEAKDKNTRGENGSIGTEATRSGLIEKLGTMSHFVELSKEKGYKNPVYKTTKAGQDFCALLPKEIIMPDISAIWEGDFEKIEKGKKTVEAFIAEVDRYIEARVNHVKSEGVPIKVEGLIECPKCDDGILVKRKGTKGFFHACNQYPNCKTSFPDLNGKPNLTPPQKANASDSEKCPDCQKGLVRREAKRKGSFWWGCSGFPTCKTRFFDKDGLPDREKGKL